MVADGAIFASDKGADTWLGRLFRKPDPEVGFEELDRRIRIVLEERYEPTAKAFLQSAEAREYFRSNVPELDEMMPYVVALAVHLERFVRRSG